jgi:hypothetical protein
MAVRPNLIIFNPSVGAPFSVTMPLTALLQDGIAYRFAYIGPFSSLYQITFTANAGQTINGGATYPLIGQNATLELVWSVPYSGWILG